MQTVPPAPDAASSSLWMVYLAIVVIAIVAALLAWLRTKNRPFMSGDVFRASRLTRGNRLFPTQVGITPTAVIQYTPRWFGKTEETIHITHVASVKIATHMLFSDVIIETSGGSDSIVCHGHRKRDAVRMKQLIDEHQTEQYRPASAGAASTEGPTRICPFCAETIKAAAKVCRYCGRELPA